ncbi:hypothetical protein [Nocardioides sp. J54]|uniref:hypothetical protein n=1 Tax=Nocardioides sp. J54 TaxID=935866 RepID=UPI00048DEFAC|nr:hypothetical protein [Nocardioides sp. J54]
MTSDPTPRELLIQLQAAVAQIDALTARLDGLTQTLASSYVPRGEYAAHREADDRRFKEVEGDLAAQAGFRRQVAAGFAVGFLLLLATVIGTLAQVPGVG